jgi:hypothetical protein
MMARICVAGAFHEDDRDEQLRDLRIDFVSALGKEIIARGHVLLGGCRNPLDAHVARAAEKAAGERELNPHDVVKSWVTASTKPSHRIGELIRSHVSDWSRVPRRHMYPEPIKQADVVIIVGGGNGTHYAASWARLANKSLVPVAAFGLAASEIYADEKSEFERRYGTRLTEDEYDILDRVVWGWSADDVNSFAKDVVSLAERLIVSTEVFVIMSFAEKGHLKDAYNTFCRVCTDYDFHAFKVDDHLDSGRRIVPSIMDAIRRSAFIIADVSEPRPNVYYELGYAQALGKDVITTAHEGTELPFDIFDVPTQFWDCQDTLEHKLRAELARRGHDYGKGESAP